MNEARTYRDWKKERIIDVEVREHITHLHVIIKTKHGYAPLVTTQLVPPFDTTFFLKTYSPHLMPIVSEVWNGPIFVLEELQAALKGRYIWYRRAYEPGILPKKKGE